MQQKSGFMNDDVIQNLVTILNLSCQ